MLMPSIFNDNFDCFGLLDNWFDHDPWQDFDRHMHSPRATSLMRTDIKEDEKGYQMDIDLPGFKKEDLSIELEKGYLTVSAQRTQEENKAASEEDAKAGRYIHQERYSGSCKRSFFVGEHLTQEDIKASFTDGILKLSFPKKDAKEVESKRYIAIEG